MAESEFRQPVRKVQPARTAEQARVPASSCARIDVLFDLITLESKWHLV